MKRVGELSFDFQYGSCNAFDFEAQQERIHEQKMENCPFLFVYPLQEVLLCFDYNTDGYNQCHSFDGTLIRREAYSSYPHRSTIGFASYEGQPFTTGSLNPRNLKTEIMDLSTKQWREAASYPFATSTL